MLVLFIVVLLAVAAVWSCSGGGRGGAAPIPLIPWSTFRQNQARSGVGIGGAADNPGVVRPIVDLAPFGGASGSTPAIGLDGTVYVGTGEGLLAIEGDGTMPRFFGGFERVCTTAGTPCESRDDCPTGEQCGCRTCDPAMLAGCRRIGAVHSTVTVTVVEDIVFGSEEGFVVSIRDTEESFSCNWVSRPLGGSIRSSPLVRTAGIDGTTLAVFIGTPGGALIAFGRDGSESWRVALQDEPLTSSPALGTDSLLYQATAHGAIHAVDLSGRPVRSFAAGPLAGEDWIPSAVAGNVIHIGDSNGRIHSFLPNGTRRWVVEADGPIASSLSVIFQPVTIDTPTPHPDPPATATPPPGEEGTPTPTPTVTPTATPILEPDIVVYAVDVFGGVIAVRESLGTVLGRTTLERSGDAVELAGSPILSADFFVIAAARDGVLHARALDGRIPCDPCADGSFGNWPVLFDAPILGAPSLDQRGIIYVVAGDTLYGVSTPPVTPTPTASASPTANAEPTATPGATE